MEPTPSRETLHHWPTEPLQGTAEWWLYFAAPDFDGIPGRFRHDDHGRIVFECESGVALGRYTFEDGERFEPCEQPEPDERDTRIAALEAEVERLTGWLARIEGGDTPTDNAEQIRRWAYEALTLGRQPGEG